MLEAEKEIVTKAQRGDAKSFGHLYDHYVKQIHRFIYLKVSSRQEAEDLTHEVFLSAWKSLPNFKIKGFPFSSWLYRIARNRVIDHYRTKRQHSNIDVLGEVIDEQFVVYNERPGQIDLKLDVEKVKQALVELSKDQQEVIILRFVEDLTPAEIAPILGKREGTIRIIQHRAVNKLKEILK